MKWITKIEKDETISFKKKNKENILIALLLFISDMVLNTFMPFFLGYYLGFQHNIIWFILFVPFLFFRIETKFNGKNIKINVIKRLFNK